MLSLQLFSLADWLLKLSNRQNLQFFLSPFRRVHDENPEKWCWSLLIAWRAAAGNTDSVISPPVTSFWSKYASSSEESGLYGGSNSLLSIFSMSSWLNQGWFRISSTPLAPRRVFFSLSRSLQIRSFASSETDILCFTGSGKLTLLSLMKWYILCLLRWKKGGMPTIIS